MARILVTLWLAVYNNVANLWPPFNRAAYVPANILTTAGLVAVAVSALDLSAADLGLMHLSPADAALGAAIGVAMAAPLLVLA
ncbi:MAG: hypothetical protein M3134_01960, partial [Actinomycetota bacterium]|nr:hypothetical protein [Actinomycetota bacterium]